MLRTILLFVLIANALLAGAIWAVHTGDWTWPDTWRGETHEPQRIEHQLRPEAIILSSEKPVPLPKPSPAPKPQIAIVAPAPPTAPASSAANNAAATNSALCLLSAGNDKALSTGILNAVRSVIPSNMALETIAGKEGGLWMVYMGKYPNIATANQKMAELDKLKVPGDYALIRDAEAFQPGISLGLFRDPDNANAHLALVGKSGVKTARVVVRATAHDVVSFKIPTANNAMKDKLNLALTRAKIGGKAFEACPNPAPAAPK